MSSGFHAPRNGTKGQGLQLSRSFGFDFAQLHVDFRLERAQLVFAP